MNTTTPKAAPTRLDQLRNMRAQIDQEIEREIRAQRRLRTLAVGVRAMAATRGDYTERVVAVTATHYGLEPDDITGHRRDSLAVAARHVTAWLLRESGRSYPEIGRALHRDHTCAMNGVRRVESDDVLATDAAAIRGLLLGPDADEAVSA